MMHVSSVSSRGQVVIPKHLRDKLNIKPNSRIVFSEMQGRLLLSVLPADPVQDARGMLKKTTPLTELMRQNRKEELARETRHHRR